MILVGRGNEGRGKSRNRVWGEMERHVRDVEKGRGWSKGGHHAHAAMTATRGTPTAPTTVLVSHSPEIPHHTTHHKTSFLATSPDNSIGNERSTGCAPHSILGTCAFGEALWKTRRRVFVPIPFRRHLTHIHNKNITPIHIRHFIHASTTRHDTPVSSPVRPSKRIDPSHDA